MSFSDYFSLAVACAFGVLAVYLADNPWAHDHPWLVPALWSVCVLSLLLAILSRKGRSGIRPKAPSAVNIEQETHGDRSTAVAVGSLGNIGSGANVNIGGTQTIHHGKSIPEIVIEYGYEDRNRSWPPLEVNNKRDAPLILKNVSTVASAFNVRVEPFTLGGTTLTFEPAVVPYIEAGKTVSVSCRVPGGSPLFANRFPDFLKQSFPPSNANDAFEDKPFELTIAYDDGHDPSESFESVVQLKYRPWKDRIRVEGVRKRPRSAAAVGGMRRTGTLNPTLPNLFPAPPLFGGVALPLTGYSSIAPLVPEPPAPLSEAECHVLWSSEFSSPKSLWLSVWNGTPRSQYCFIRLISLRRWSDAQQQFIDVARRYTLFPYPGFEIYRENVVPETGHPAKEIGQRKGKSFELLGIERSRSVSRSETGRWQIGFSIKLGEQTRNQTLVFEWTATGFKWEQSENWDWASDLLGNVLPTLEPSSEEVAEEPSRLRMGGFETGPVGLGPAYVGYCLEIENTERAYLHTIDNIRATLTFTHDHTGESYETEGWFLRMDQQRFTAKPEASVSLTSRKRAYLAFVVSVAADRTVRTFSNPQFEIGPLAEWTYRPEDESEMGFGDWTAEVTVTSDDLADYESASIRFNVDDNGVPSFGVR